MKMKRSLFGAAMVLMVGMSVPAVTRAQAGPEQPDMTLGAADRSTVIDGVLRELNTAYIFPDVAKKMEKSVRERAKRKEYDGITSAKALAEKLTTDLQEVSKDKHLRVRYSHEKVRDFSAPPSAAEVEERRGYGQFINQGFDRIERLEGNIGYLKFRGFFDPSTAGQTAAAAMAFLQDTDALIIDLRENGGGDPAMVALLCSYFFDQPTHLNDLYDRVANSTQQYWTLPYVPGARYLDKEVYLLTSSYTFSGAEEFTYNLKNLKRATVVGEVTGGGAHPVDAKRVTDHFLVGVPYARAINPITKTNWEGTGVAPDVKTSKEEAQRTAHQLALKNLLAKEKNEKKRFAQQRALDKLAKELQSSNDKASAPASAAR